MFFDYNGKQYENVPILQRHIKPRASRSISSVAQSSAYIGARAIPQLIKAFLAILAKPSSPQ